MRATHLGGGFSVGGGETLFVFDGRTRLNFPNSGTVATIDYLPASVVYYGADPTGVKDSSPAFAAAIATGREVYVPAGEYLIESSILLSNSRMFGAGAKLSTLIGSELLDPFDAILYVGATAVVHDLGFEYELGAITDTEVEGERVCVASVEEGPGSFALQRGSTLRNLLFADCGTALYASALATIFSVEFNTMEFVDFSYRAIDVRSANRTGCVWRNLYIATSRPNADRGFSLSGGGSEARIDQINVEHSILNYSMAFENEKGLSVGTLHVEGIQQRNPNTGYILFDNTSGDIDIFVALNTRMNLTGGAVIELGNSQNVDPNFSNFDTNTVSFGSIFVQGLNWPSSVLYPHYTNKGLNNVTNYALILRAVSATNAYVLSNAQYIWANYDGAQDATYYQNPPLNPNANITIERWVSFPSFGQGSTYLSVQIPDGTPAGGNARGVGSFDNSRSRITAAQVASGAYAVITAGQNCTASATGSFASGFFAISAGAYSVALGQGVQTSQSYSVSMGKDASDLGNFGTWSYGSGFFTTPGDVEFQFGMLRVATSAASARFTADATAANANNTLNFVVDNSGYELSIRGMIKDTVTNDTAVFFIDHLNVRRKTGAGSVLVNGSASPVALTISNAEGTLSGTVSVSIAADTTNGGAVILTLAQTGSLSLRAGARCDRTRLQ